MSEREERQLLSVVELKRTTPNVEGALHALRGEGLVLGLVTVTDAMSLSDQQAAESV